ncbi:MAG: hypothetical protein L0G99_06540 [Propionibacteriales bacterium]|nr:hypothetical protein [Propionibacteriales bacterium]
MSTVDRTQRAIIDAAISTWARDPAASLGVVAAAAGVGRTTLHRFHPDRAALLAAVNTELQIQFGQATARAVIDDGPAMAALRRLCIEFLALGEPLRMVFADNSPVDPEAWTSGDGSHQHLQSLFHRGQADGSFDETLDPEWMLLTMWLLLFGAWAVMDETKIPRADAADLLMRTLAGAVGAKPSDFAFKPG